MLKNLKMTMLVMLVLSIFTIFNVNAESKTVTSETELKEALQNESIDEIILGNDIETTSKINVLRPVTIDGKNHTIKYVGTFKGGKDNTVWDGIYVIQVYKTTATIKDIKLTGGNAALLINGSNVRLEGTIDVSGNGFGGIELGRGSGVETVPEVEMNDDTNLVNDTETASKPSLWVPSDTEEAIVEYNGVEHKFEAGEEFSLTVLENILDPVNPATSDSITISIILSLISLMTIIYGYQKIHN